MAVSEMFKHKGQMWRRIPAEPIDEFVLGVDLGQSIDPTALSLVHRQQSPLETWDIDHDHRVTKQKVHDQFDVRHLERLPLGKPYPEVVQYVAALLRRPPLDEGCLLVIDETGVGRAVGDIFDEAGLEPIRITITAGSDVMQQTWRRFNVAKTLLISTLDARLHTGELRFAADLTDAGALADELKDFRRKVSDVGRASYAARTGKHDDLVLATAIAVWVAAGKGRVPDPSVGALEGLH